ncbi:hypothetical protein Hanom_Chr02g00120601 [Helianthus anomalus]
MKTSSWILNQYSIHSEINRVVTIRSSKRGSLANCKGVNFLVATLADFLITYRTLKDLSL